MRERGIPDQFGRTWNFPLTHPKGGEAALTIQPPGGFDIRKFPPRFEAAPIRDFLNDATEPS